MHLSSKAPIATGVALLSSWTLLDVLSLQLGCNSCAVAVSQLGMAVTSISKAAMPGFCLYVSLLNYIHAD